MPAPCKYWKDQADGFHGDCTHPQYGREPCILNTEDVCLLREEPGEELESIHTCAVCGRTMPSVVYEREGCIFCGADADEGGE